MRQRQRARLVIHFAAGTHITDCCWEALRLANKLDVIVEWNTNSIPCVAYPGGLAGLIEEKYTRDLSERVEGPK